MSQYKEFIDNLITALDSISTTSFRTEPIVEYGVKLPEETNTFPHLYVSTEIEDFEEMTSIEAEDTPVAKIYGYVHSDDADLCDDLEDLYQDCIEKLTEDDTFSNTILYYEMESETSLMSPYGIFIITIKPFFIKEKE